jgi:hypothetical protein
LHFFYEPGSSAAIYLPLRRTLVRFVIYSAMICDNLIFLKIIRLTLVKTKNMLNISIPDDLNNELSLLTNDKTAFIIEAVREKIALYKNTMSQEDLINERSNIFGHKVIIEEFKSTRIENWGDY